MLANPIYSLAHDAKGTPFLQYSFFTKFIERHDRLLSILFQVLFHSPFRRSFHFSLAVLFTIGYLFVFRFEDGSSLTSFLLKEFFFLNIGPFQKKARSVEISSYFNYTGLSPSLVVFFKTF